jgi:hypothetical protein
MYSWPVSSSAVPLSYSFPFSSIVVPISSSLIRKVGSSWIVVLLLAEASESLPDGHIRLTKELSKGCPVELSPLIGKPNGRMSRTMDSKSRHCHTTLVGIARNKICCLHDINGCLID